MYLLTSFSHFAPTIHPLQNANLLSVSMSLVLFVLFFRFHIKVRLYNACLSLPSKFIHVVANGRFYSFLRKNSISLSIWIYVYIYICMRYAYIWSMHVFLSLAPSLSLNPSVYTLNNEERTISSISDVGKIV